MKKLTINFREDYLEGVISEEDLGSLQDIIEMGDVGDEEGVPKSVNQYRDFSLFENGNQIQANPNSPENLYGKFYDELSKLANQENIEKPLIYTSASRILKQAADEVGERYSLAELLNGFVVYSDEQQTVLNTALVHFLVNYSPTDNQFDLHHSQLLLHRADGSKIDYSRYLIHVSPKYFKICENLNFKIFCVTHF